MSPDKLRQTEQDQKNDLVEPTARKIDLILDQATSLPERNGSITVFMERARSWFKGVQVKRFR